MNWKGWVLITGDSWEFVDIKDDQVFLGANVLPEKDETLKLDILARVTDKHLSTELTDNIYQAIFGIVNLGLLE